MDAAPLARLAAGHINLSGFVVSRDEAGLELTIPAPSRVWSIFLTWAINLPLLGLCAVFLSVALFACCSNDDSANFCGITSALVLMPLLGAIVVTGTRLTIRAHRRKPLTRIGVRNGVLWCESADERVTCHWPVGQVLRVRARPARFMKLMQFEVWALNRPFVGLRIPCREHVETDPLINMLRHAMWGGADRPPALAGVRPSTEPGNSDGESIPLATVRTDDSTLAYHKDESSIRWMCAGSYQGFVEMQAARRMLSILDIVSRIGPSASGPSAGVFDLFVPDTQLATARQLIAHPQGWNDPTCCPRCGDRAQPISFFRRIARSLRHPTEPIALGSAWRWCETCQRLFLT